MIELNPLVYSFYIISTPFEFFGVENLRCPPSIYTTLSPQKPKFLLLKNLVTTPNHRVEKGLRNFLRFLPHDVYIIVVCLLQSYPY